MANIPVGLQLYTLRNETEKDFIGTLKKVAELGYQAVEFAGYGDIDAKEMKRVLDGLGLKAVSSHVPMDKLENQLEQEIEYLKEIGAPYIACPWLPTERFTEPQQFAELRKSFESIGKTVSDSGLTFMYHNHDFEFAKMDGKYLLDVLYESMDASVLKAELDLYWVKKAGLDPKAYVEQYSGRVPIIHVKDMADDADRSFAEVGHGVMDYPSILAAAEKAGVSYFIVEQDQCKRPPLESVKMSIAYLKSIGIA